jgi:hypothetical protein
MKRREFVEKLGIGSALVVSSSALAAPGLAANDGDDNGDHDHRPVRGPVANATVSFGAWHTGSVTTPAGTLPPLDRVVTPIPAPPYNVHQLIPYVARIREGGSVNFIISGLHQVAVYGPGTKPEDIRKAIDPGPNPVPPAPPFQNVRPMAGPPGLALINVPENRVYIGPDPSLLNTLDRIEVVHFGDPGLYLVICAFAWVRVLKQDHDRDRDD